MDDVVYRLQKDLVGKSLSEAQAECDKEFLKYRDVEQDGKQMGITDDFRPLRLNFTVVKNMIKSVSLG